MKIEADLTGWLGLEEALKTRDVIAFRAPIPGDTYLSVGGGICDSHGGVSEPRPILRKRSPTDDQVREAVKKALEDIGCDDMLLIRVGEWLDGLVGVVVSFKR